MHKHFSSSIEFEDLMATWALAMLADCKLKLDHGYSFDYVLDSLPHWLDWTGIDTFSIGFSEARRSEIEAEYIFKSARFFVRVLGLSLMKSKKSRNRKSDFAAIRNHEQCVDDAIFGADYLVEQLKKREERETELTSEQ